jgi:hypothetical protein
MVDAEIASSTLISIFCIMFSLSKA